jgi:hypothetical protein
MTSAEILFVALMKYHSQALDADPTYEDRVHMIADAIDDVCEKHPIKGWPKVGCMALVATTAKWESGFLKEIHDGKRGPSGEICLMQLHRSVTNIPKAEFAITKTEWENSAGSNPEHTHLCMELGLRVIAWHVTRCKLRFEGGGYSPAMLMFAEYHHPSTQCLAIIHHGPADPPHRAMSYQLLLNHLRYDKRAP